MMLDILEIVVVVAAVSWAAWKTLEARRWRMLAQSVGFELATTQQALEIACKERDKLFSTAKRASADVARMLADWADIQDELTKFDPARKVVVHMDIESIGMCYCVPAKLYEPMLKRLRAWGG